MDASLTDRVEELAEEIAGQARTAEDLNGLMQQLMKTVLQRMLDTELEVHLGRRGGVDEVAGREPHAEDQTVSSLPIESVNSVIRKLTRNRKISPNAESAFKITYLAIQEASKKWTMPVPPWKAALNHFAILFEGRLPQ